MGTIKIAMILIIVTVIIIVVLVLMENVSNEKSPICKSVHIDRGDQIETPIKTKAIVIARYGEELDWLSDLTKESEDPEIEINFYVYNKGKDLTVNGKYKYIRLPNMGVCDHTYLYHIIDNYDHLEDVTVFLPASWTVREKAWKKRKTLTHSDFYHSFFSDVVVDRNLYDFTINHYKIADSRNRDTNDYNLSLCSIRPYGKWYEKVMGKPLANNIVNYGGIFSVSKEIIRKYPKSFYQELISYLDKARFPEASHYMERLWYDIFKFNVYTYELGLLVIVKNEEMIIEEFLKHYLWQGVEHFYVIDNGSTDSTKNILSKYPVTYYYAKEKHRQTKHYNTVFNERKTECKWLIVCDCDEYIYNRERGKTIKDYVMSLDHNKISNVKVKWKMFGSSGYAKQPESIRESFIHRKRDLDPNTKQIVNTSLTTSLGIHNSNHTHKSPVIEPEQLALNHYAIMSREYFGEVKMTRGDASNYKADNVRDWAYFDRYDHAEVIDVELKELLGC